MAQPEQRFSPRAHFNSWLKDERENFPKAAFKDKRDFYVDDDLSGSNYQPEALDQQKQLIQMLNSAGFTLHK
jgi:hypothetical protein